MLVTPSAILSFLAEPTAFIALLSADMRFSCSKTAKVNHRFTLVANPGFIARINQIFTMTL
jgi:hypothetical protein